MLPRHKDTKYKYLRAFVPLWLIKFILCVLCDSLCDPLWLRFWIQKKTPPRRGYSLKGKVYFTELTTAAKASGLFMARSASALRLRAIPFSFNLPINSE